MPHQLHPLLKPHQVKTVEYNLKNRYVINALQMGLGKSLCAIETGVALGAKTLVVCPAYLKYKWRNEILKFYPTARVSLLHRPSEFYRLWDTDFCIISYSFLREAEILFEWATLVVYDEAHGLKGTNTARTQAAHRLTYENSIPHCLLLTGTPIQNRVHEFYSLIGLCKYDPKIGKDDFLDRFPTYVDFAENFSHLRQFEMPVTTKKGKKVRIKVDKWHGIKNIPELREILRGHYIEFKSSSILNLPEYQVIDIPVEYKNNPELQEAFDSATGEQAGMGVKAKVASAVAMAPYTISFAKDLAEDGPVVIFTDHVESCQKIADGLGVPAITGLMPTKRREELGQEFMDGKSTFVVATIESFSTGIDLQISNKMIFNDPSWVPGKMEQAMFRIIRIGQRNRCFFYRMSGSYQSQHIYDSLFEKLATINKTLEGLSHGTDW